MKKQYLLGVSIVALGLAAAPAFADVDAELEDSLNGNGAGNDTQTDITGDASNTPQTGDENVRGNVGSGNEFDITLSDDKDGNGFGNDTFQNDGTATNTPQTGAGNVRGSVGSNNTLDDNSSDTENSAISEGNAANNGSIDNVSASGEGIAINDSNSFDGPVHFENGERGGAGINIAGGDIAGESIDSNTASEDATILNDVGGEGGEGGGLNMATGDVAEGEGSDIKKTETAAGVAYADRDSAAVVVGTVEVLFDTDAVASNTEMSAANVLNIASANVAIGGEDAEAKLSASADISGGPVDGVSLGQFSANAGSQGVTEQSQTVTANIGTGSF